VNVVEKPSGVSCCVVAGNSPNVGPNGTFSHSRSPTGVV
jgi:hypothetical protein